MTTEMATRHRRFAQMMEEECKLKWSIKAECQQFKYINLNEQLKEHIGIWKVLTGEKGDSWFLDISPFKIGWIPWIFLHGPLESWWHLL